jgi:DnaJ domain
VHQRSPFAILGVSPQAEREVIRAAYRALAKEYHPDIRRGLPGKDTTRRMAEINWAFEELNRDLADWRERLRDGDGAEQVEGSWGPSYREPAARPSRTEQEDFYSAYARVWREHTEKTRSQKWELRDWRDWVGLAGVVIVAIPIVGYLLSLVIRLFLAPVFLVLYAAGVSISGPPWEWCVHGQALTGIVLGLELGIFAVWNVVWKRLYPG